jgi:hypothetical protein
MSARGRLLALVFFIGAKGCVSAPRAEAALYLRCSAPLARVYLDDRFVGRAVELGRGLKVRSGARRVEVRADGYFTAYRDVMVARGGEARLEVRLRPVPDGEPGE